MKIVFVVYHDLNIEARSQETLEALKMLGEVSVVTFKKIEYDKTVRVHLSNYSRYLPGVRYLLFLLKAITVIKNERPDMVLLHDCSLLILYIKKNHKKTKIVYDQSELYIDRNIKSIKSRLLKRLDNLDEKYIKYADVTISANKERADIMKEHFSLPESPIVFDNIHRIDDEFDVEKCQNKYDKYFAKGCFHIVYAGGIQERRMTYELIDAVGKLGDEYRLVIAGAIPEGLERFHTILREQNYSNIWYVGFIPRSEWRYLLTKAEASFVAFSTDTLNNIYCASGKMYESLFEEVPILTSENPPLKRLCVEERVGVSNNNYIEGLITLKNNYSYYKKNTRKYIEKVDYDGRIESLYKEISKRLIDKN